MSRPLDPDLIVMRLADMARIHPGQDNSRKCSGCGQPVGIYPSGQSMIRRQPNIRIICNHCYKREPGDVEILVPGALEEPLESVPAPGYRKP